MAILISIGKTPGVMSPCAVDTGSTVGDAVEASGLDTEGFEARLNGEPCDEESELSNGDVVTFAKKIKSA